MQTRPFYKRVLKFLGVAGNTSTTPPPNPKHEYKLPEPAAPKRYTKRGRGRYRNPPIMQGPSRDPRFNHSLRRQNN